MKTITSADKFATISPVDGKIYQETTYTDSQTIATILKNSQKAQKKWRQTPLKERMALCRAALDYFKTNKNHIAEEITWQMGRPITQSPGEINGMIERAEYMIDIAEAALADITPPLRKSSQRFIRREPVGTVFTIAPWNYPYLTAINSIIPALLSGNTLILKHATQTPLCGERFFAAFQSTDLPAGVFQIVHTDYETTAAIVRNPAINYVAFTGSVSGGHAISKAASDRFIGLGLELGGKDPAYVRPDCHLQKTIETLVDGSFFNSGQSCCGIERIYVHNDCYDQFVEGFVDLTKSYRLGIPTETITNLGPVIRDQSAFFILDQINEAQSKGADIITLPKLNDMNANYLQPHILLNVTHDMRVMTEETFGPVVGIMKVDNDEQAIALMNDSEYGLTASIWTEDRDHGIQLGNQLETGTVFLNRCDYLDPALPWTGVKNTGHGYSLSTLGFEQLTQAKSFNIN